jgi:type IV pilus assembly protein PilV
VSGLRNHQRGVSLIEVLVTVLVTSIGLLGLAGLQATSLRNNHGAYLRSQATILAYDILDRMRGNAAAARAGAYEVEVDGGGDGTTSGDSNSEGSGVDPIAALDLAQWQAEIDRLLPEGRGSITMEDSVNNVVSVTIRWEDSVTEDDESSSFTFTTQITDG